MPFLSLGCSSKKTLDHSITTKTFEDKIQFSWSLGKTFEGDTKSTQWKFSIAEPDIEGCQVIYSLYLCNKDEKHFMRGSTDYVALPLLTNVMSHDTLGPAALEGGWNLQLDYELYTSDKNLILKGSISSPPNPAQRNQ